MKKKFGCLLILIILIFTLIYTNTSSFKEKKYYIQSNNEIKDFIADVDNNQNAKENLIKKLQEDNDNKDIVGVLSIPGTDYSSVVPKPKNKKNEQFYLRRLPNKEYNRLGSTYMDYRSDLENGNKIVIYGHNFTQHDLGPFDILENYYNQDYYNEHKIINLTTESGIKSYEIFSVYVATSNEDVDVDAFDYYYKWKYKTKESWLRYLVKVQEKSMINTDVKLSDSDKILILQTCSTKDEYSKFKKKYLLIFSREVIGNEKNI